tara:strand:- start:13037 stop:13447 length:411 start_codon:yes stop_codon:yes gene_type:complete
MSKVIAHNTLPGVMLAIVPAVLQADMSPTAEPNVLKNDKATPYHWMKVVITDNNGQAQTGSTILWDKLLQSNPSDYTAGQTIEIEIQLNGDVAGASQVHLGTGRFDVANLIDADELKKFNLAPAANATTQTVPETT